MLNKLEIHTKDGRQLALPIYGPESYPVLDITGLDPVKASIVSSSFAQMDGVQYQSSKRETRNILIKLGLNSIDPKSLRKELYSYLSPKNEVELRFFDDDYPTVVTTGRVEFFDAPMFVRDPQVTVSILCFDPDFYSLNTTTFSGNSVTTATDANLTYSGDVSSGFIFKLSVNQTIDEFSIEGVDSSNVSKSLIVSTPTFSLLSGDLVTVSTIPGNKYITLIRAGVTSSLLWGVDPTSNWFSLYPGINKIRVAAPFANIPYTIEYNARFGGL